MQRRFLVLLFVATACARSTPPRAAAVAPEAAADTSQQARIGRFFQVYSARSTPLLRDGNYLGLITLLRALDDSAGHDPVIHNIAGQQEAAFLSFVGRPREAAAVFDSLYPGAGDTTTHAELDAWAMEDAVTALVRIADTAQVLMINEAHHVPASRALVFNLLGPLRAHGYTVLAAETFGESDSALNQRGYAVRETGYYSNEPLFGAVLREALRLGFTLVPYEALNARRQDDRERIEAEHLRDRAIQGHPGAKVLVLAGYDHINESGRLGDAVPMAARFRELTGINPVTVDQTVLRERSDTVFEPAVYRRLAGRGLAAPTVLLEPGTGRPWSARPGVHDVTVMTPRTVWREGRPGWLWNAGDRHAVALERGACDGAPRCVVEARRAGEAEGAVPEDALLVERGGSPPPLLVRPGSYVVTSRDAAGSVRRTRRVEVSAAR